MEENKALQIATTETSSISNKIHIIRGEPVMLDFDLAPLYGYEVRSLNQQVKRNIDRFPADFMFQLTRKEVDSVRSQFVISQENGLFMGKSGGTRWLPYAFTEQGIYMLATVLKGKVAAQQSIFIMRAFKEVRHFIADNGAMLERISVVELHQLKVDERLDQVFAYISEHAESSEKIFFEGQIYDAFSLLVSLVRKAKNNVVLIDGYVDINTLNILAKKREGTAVRVCTHPDTRLTDRDIHLFNMQYPSLAISYSTAFHDRFLILDEQIVYHIGASLKDAGKKCFAITRMEDPDAADALLKKLDGNTQKL